MFVVNAYLCEFVTMCNRTFKTLMCNKTFQNYSLVDGSNVFPFCLTIFTTLRQTHFKN